MKVDKIVLSDDSETELAAVENIPVSEGIIYKEIIEDDKLVAIKGLDNSGNVITTVNATDYSKYFETYSETESDEPSAKPDYEKSKEDNISNKDREYSDKGTNSSNTITPSTPTKPNVYAPSQLDTGKTANSKTGTKADTFFASTLDSVHIKLLQI